MSEKSFWAQYKNLMFLCALIFGLPIVGFIFFFLDKPMYTGKTLCGSIYEMTKSGGGYGAGQRGVVLHDFAKVRLDNGDPASIEQAIGRKVGERVSYQMYEGRLTGRVIYQLDYRGCE
jgi:hypothetical protein